MNKLLSLVLRMAFKALVESPLRRAKIRAVIYYLEMIRAARKAVMALGVLMFCVLLMAGGAVLIPLALCLFMPWPPETKALVACAFGVVYVIGPLIVAMVLMSEKRWMRITRADRLLNDVLGKQ
ncbi:MAG: hypothetical protein HZB43_07625 [candidate division Zixibacteria bacterium]|nr:hypothetical protein [candidate division Zixibacteria bacterium]